MSQVRTFNSHDHHHLSCRKCEESFKVGDRVVSVAVTHGWDHGYGRNANKGRRQHHRTRLYHTRCYVDAHGVPIYD